MYYCSYFYYFNLGHGADIDLQTTVAGRTVFHLVLASEASDLKLLEDMVGMGALVNLTDVHGSTPLMDAIECRTDSERAVETYKMIQGMGKVIGLICVNKKLLT